MAKKKAKSKIKGKEILVGLPEVEEKKIGETDDKTHESIIKRLQLECMQMEYQIGWFPRTKQASMAAKSAMTKAISATVDGYSITKRLFASQHPDIKELNTRRANIGHWRDSYAVILATKPSQQMVADENDSLGDEADVPEGDVELVDDDTSGQSDKIARGLRLIEIKKIDEFTEGFHERVQAMFQQAKIVQSKMEEIKAFDKEKLGDDFKDEDYPADIVSLIKVTGPHFTEFTVSAKLPPKVYAKQVANIESQLNKTIEQSCNYVGNILVAKFSDLVEQLVNRQELHPRVKSGYTKYEGAELIKVRKKDETTSQITVKYEVPVTDSDGSFVKMKYQEDKIELPTAEWRDILQPVPVSKRRKLYSSTVDQILGWLSNFKNVKGMLGVYGDGMQKELDQVYSMMSQLTRLADDESPEGIAEVLRSGDIYREDLANKLSDAAAGIAAVGEVAKKTARRINKKYVGLL